MHILFMYVEKENEGKIYIGVVFRICLLFFFVFMPPYFDFKILNAKTFY